MPTTGCAQEGCAKSSSLYNSNATLPELEQLIVSAERGNARQTWPPWGRHIWQTAKNGTLPSFYHERFSNWTSTWRELNPTYTYHLTGDRENRDFVSQHYPWFLPTYDSYDESIKRADAVRIFLLHHFGGVYADIDFRCLRPLDELFALPQAATADVLLGQLRAGPDARGGRSAIDSVPNAIMISRPRAPFWLHVMQELVRRVNVATAMFDTGPQVLHHVYQTLGKQHHVRLLPSAYLYPIDWMTPGWVGLAKWRRAYLGDEWYNRTNTTFAVTYWMHTYGHTSG